MRTVLTTFTALSFVLVFGTACKEEKKKSPSGDSDASVSVDGSVDLGDSGGGGGGGGNLPGALQFPINVIFLTYGKANSPVAEDDEISIHAGNLDYDYAYEYGEGGALVTKDRVFHLESRIESAPGDLPPGDSIKFWWTKTNPEGEVTSFVCRVLGNTERFTLKADQAYDGAPGSYDPDRCDWELVPVPDSEDEYAIRAPEEGTSGGVFGSNSYYVLGTHAGQTEGYRIRVDGTAGTQAQFFTLESPPGGTP